MILFMCRHDHFARGPTQSRFSDISNHSHTCAKGPGSRTDHRRRAQIRSGHLRRRITFLYQGRRKIFRDCLLEVRDSPIVVCQFPQ